MPNGPQRKKTTNPRGPNKVYGTWHGGPNYAHGEPEQFRSQSHARDVMRQRIGGWDPMSGKQTPVVQDSTMDLARDAGGEPFRRLSQTNRGIKRENY